MKPLCQFDAETHQYKIGDVIVPSVTTILKHSGLYKGIGFFTNARASFGSKIHQLCEDYDNGISPLDIPKEYEPYVDGWIAWRRKTQYKAILIECPLFYDVQPNMFAGTIDRVFACDNDIYLVVDIKTGNPQQAAETLQLAAYRMLYMTIYSHVLQPDATILSACVYLSKTGKYEVELMDTNYEDYFKSCLQLYHYKRQHRLLL